MKHVFIKIMTLVAMVCGLNVPVMAMNEGALEDQKTSILDCFVEEFRKINGCACWDEAPSPSIPLLEEPSPTIPSKKRPAAIPLEKPSPTDYWFLFNSERTDKTEPYKNLCTKLNAFFHKYEKSLADFFVAAVQSKKIDMIEIVVFRNRLKKLCDGHNYFRAMKSSLKGSSSQKNVPSESPTNLPSPLSPKKFEPFNNQENVPSESSTSLSSPPLPKELEAFNNPYLNKSINNALIRLTILEARDFAKEVSYQALPYVKQCFYKTDKAIGLNFASFFLIFNMNY